MTIRAVIWDMGGVLLRTFDRSLRERWEARLGLGAGELDRIVFENRASQKASVGLADEAEIWDEVRARLKLSAAEIAALRKDFFEGDRVDQALMAFIRGLRPALQVGMITNAWPEVRRYLEQEWKIADAFDPLIISAEVGLVKPDVRIYQLALERLGLPAFEVVFVDDFEENLIAARALGMHAIHFQTASQATEDVRALVGGLQGGEQGPPGRG